MGKKRQFKKSTDKKGSDSGAKSRFRETAPGIVIPGDTTYIDNRPAPADFVQPEPPRLLSPEEWLAEKNEVEKPNHPAGEDSSDKASSHEQAPAENRSDEPVSIKPGSKKQVSNKKTGKPGKSNDQPASELVEAGTDEKKHDQPRPDEEKPDDQHPSDSPDEPVRVDFKNRKRVADILEELKYDVELEATRRQLLASAWRARDKIYKQLFGKPAYITPANYGPPSEDVPPDFAERNVTGADTSNPGDPTMEEQHLAVLAYGPDPTSPCWRYVTAGLSSPWVQYEPLQVSGFGCELMVKSPVDAPWAARFLRTLAFYIFNHAGTLSQGVRLALNNPIDPASSSKLRNAFIWYADEAPDTLYELPSGLFGILLAIGMTDDELAFADSVEDYGTWCLQALLRQAGHGQITDPARDCSMKMENINAMKTSVRNFADTFRANRNGLFTVSDTTF